MNNRTNIYLVGLMGAGKTTVGRQLARRLGRVFYDSDHEIVERTGVPIPTIFEIEGEDGFRRREAQTIAELSINDNIVLATGGGVVLNPENRRRLHETGWVVYLNVPPVMLFERTRNDRNRPLLRVPDPLARLEELHALRDPLYRETAHLVVDGSHLIASGIVQHLLREFGLLCKK
ncbi:shikimate kinase [Quatrionicoccus australiensis]|nr:shikimate kinase [Quatrionicoccus australiensis]UCV15322.1 shikimate kinase [Quatrionicoccus australiensis]